MSGDIALLGPHGLHGLVGRGGSAISFAESTTVPATSSYSTTFTDRGDPITVTVGGDGRAVIGLRVTVSSISNSSLYVCYRLSGANVLASSTGRAAVHDLADGAGATSLVESLTGLAPGETVVTPQLRGVSGSSTVTFSAFSVVAFGF